MSAWIIWPTFSAKLMCVNNCSTNASVAGSAGACARAVHSSGCTLSAGADGGGDAAARPKNKSEATAAEAGNEDKKFSLRLLTGIDRRCPWDRRSEDLTS